MVYPNFSVSFFQNGIAKAGDVVPQIVTFNKYNDGIIVDSKVTAPNVKINEDIKYILEGENNGIDELINAGNEKIKNGVYYEQFAPINLKRKKMKNIY